MGVEPTLDQEAGRATVLKTVERLFEPCSRMPQMGAGKFKSQVFVLLCGPR